MTTSELTEHFAREHPKNIPDRIRRDVLDRDNSQCRACGTGGDNRLQLHHCEFRSQGGTHDAWNLVTVCFRCHDLIHRNKLGIELIEVNGRMEAFCRRPRRLNQSLGSSK